LVSTPSKPHNGDRTHSSLFFENSTAASSPFFNDPMLLLDGMLLLSSVVLMLAVDESRLLPLMLIDIDDIAAYIWAML